VIISYFYWLGGKVNKIFPPNGYFGDKPKDPTYGTMIIDDKVYKICNAVVHTFEITEGDDPVMYAGEKLLSWQTSESGKWIIEHAIESPIWHHYLQHTTLSYKFTIMAKLKERDYSYFLLKWGQQAL
jgi:hypothetical protein